MTCPPGGTYCGAPAAGAHEHQLRLDVARRGAAMRGPVAGDLQGQGLGAGAAERIARPEPGARAQHEGLAPAAGVAARAEAGGGEALRRACRSRGPPSRAR